MEREEPYAGRSECWLRLGRSQKALNDASVCNLMLKRRYAAMAASDGDKKRRTKRERAHFFRVQSRALFCKAEALYSLNKFEKALIFYQRCMRLRTTGACLSLLAIIHLKCSSQIWGVRINTRRARKGSFLCTCRLISSRHT